MNFTLKVAIQILKSVSGLSGEISINLSIIELFLSCSDFMVEEKYVSLLEFFLNPDSGGEENIKKFFHPMDWSESGPYISNLFVRIQHCFLNMTRKFSYSLDDDENTRKVLTDLANQCEQVVGSHYSKLCHPGFNFINISRAAFCMRFIQEVFLLLHFRFK